MNGGRWFGVAALFLIVGLALGGVFTPASNSQQPAAKTNYSGRYQMYAPNASTLFVIDTTNGKCWKYNMRATGNEIDTWADLGAPLKIGN